MTFVKIERQGKHASGQYQKLESQLIALMDMMTSHKRRVCFMLVCFSITIFLRLKSRLCQHFNLCSFFQGNVQSMFSNRANLKSASISHEIFAIISKLTRRGYLILVKVSFIFFDAVDFSLLWRIGLV